MELDDGAAGSRWTAGREGAVESGRVGLAPLEPHCPAVQGPVHVLDQLQRGARCLALTELSRGAWGALCCLPPS